MEYFILELDENYTPPNLIRGTEKLNPRILKNTRWYQMPKYMMFELKQDMQRVFTDIMFHPCFMVSETVRKAIMLYEPYMEYISVIVADREKKISRRYYIPVQEEVDCLTDNSRFNVDKSVIYHAQVDESRIRGKVLVSVSGINCRCILIRMDLAESILRRHTIGIGLKEIDMVNMQKNF